MNIGGRTVPATRADGTPTRVRLFVDPRERIGHAGASEIERTHREFDRYRGCGDYIGAAVAAQTLARIYGDLGCENMAILWAARRLDCEQLAKEAARGSC